MLCPVLQIVAVVTDSYVLHRSHRPSCLPRPRVFRGLQKEQREKSRRGYYADRADPREQKAFSLTAHPWPYPLEGVFTQALTSLPKRAPHFPAPSPVV